MWPLISTKSAGERIERRSDPRRNAIIAMNMTAWSLNVVGICHRVMSGPVHRRLGEGFTDWLGVASMLESEVWRESHLPGAERVVGTDQ
jgi:hypothetical protein